ncbi:MAG: hypothetical protein P8L44_02855, partial [Opitutales bacterium]|nr:hypothetical protein [Opitutales bacterium]
ANQLLKSLNPKLDDEFIRYSINAMIEYNLVTGSTKDPEMIGHIDPARIEREIDQLIKLGLLSTQLKAENIIHQSSLNHPTP